jgi:hypothetical protein
MDHRRHRSVASHRARGIAAVSGLAADRAPFRDQIPRRRQPLPGRHQRRRAARLPYEGRLRRETRGEIREQPGRVAAVEIRSIAEIEITLER